MDAVTRNDFPQNTNVINKPLLRQLSRLSAAISLSSLLFTGVVQALPNYQVDKVDLNGAVPVAMNDQGQILLVQPSQFPGANTSARLFDLNLNKMIGGFDLSSFASSSVFMTDLAGDIATGYGDPDESDAVRSLLTCSLATGRCDRLDDNVTDRAVDVQANLNGFAAAYYRNTNNGAAAQSVFFQQNGTPLNQWGQVGTPSIQLQDFAASSASPLAWLMKSDGVTSNPIIGSINNASGQLQARDIQGASGGFWGAINSRGRLALVQSQSPWALQLCDVDKNTGNCVGGLRGTGINLGNGYFQPVIRGGRYYPNTVATPSLSDNGLLAGNEQNSAGHPQGYLLDTNNLQKVALNDASVFTNLNLSGAQLGEKRIRDYFKKQSFLNVSSDFQRLFPNEYSALPAGLSRDQLINELINTARQAETNGSLPTELTGLFDANTYYLVTRQITPAGNILAEVRTPVLSSSSAANKLMLSNEILQALVYRQTNQCDFGQFSLTASKPLVDTSEAISFDATAFGCDKNGLRYRFLVDGAVKQGWGSSSHLSLNTGLANAGEHVVRAELRNASGQQVASDEYQLKVKGIPCSFDRFTLGSSTTDMEVGKNLRLYTETAQSGTCSGQVSYRLQVNGKVLANWQGGSYKDWNPSGFKAGKYEVIVDAFYAGKQIRRSVMLQLRPTISVRPGQFWFIHWATVNWGGLAGGNVKLYKNSSMKFTKNDGNEFYLYVGGATFHVCDEQNNNCSRTVRAH